MPPSGTCRATADALNRNGCPVFNTARWSEPLAATRAPSLEPIRLDVTKEASNGAAFDGIEANARWGLDGTAEEMTHRRFP
ncbi:MAG: hypothetical protein AVDCRST_MAG19-4780 [uncultured Thermomicrobiales bacterium]|uniref:Uncharacterized protein n=1 Tax=uncultured Thermomicrobiales bacterium TaxID=1645740 RepID=A0A6J4VPX8_9BACT|nr:MAG: hypothetical protein AVDCRST_MAG19-4780 [uncultured Thermomicrobiales bacterium]